MTTWCRSSNELRINLRQTCNVWNKESLNASRNLLEVYFIVLLISLTLYGIGLHGTNEQHYHYVMLQRLWADVAILEWFEVLGEPFCLSSIQSLFILLSMWTCFYSFLVFSPIPLSDLPYFLKLRRIQIPSYSRLCAWWLRESGVSIIPISLILSSIQLFPKFGLQAPVSWLSNHVFEKATSFYVNPFSDRFSYLHIS